MRDDRQRGRGVDGSRRRVAVGELGGRRGRVQAVDPGWPQVGATLTYGIGDWPLVLPGAARVTQCWPSRALAPHGDAPFGGIDVQVRVDSASTGCTLVMREDVVSGPASLVPAPLRAAAIGARNAETLRRLALLAEAPSP